MEVARFLISTGGISLKLPNFMKINNVVASVLGALGAFTLSILLLFSGTANVEAAPFLSHQQTPAVTMLNQQEQQEVQRLRLELEMRDRVQEEVDRAFSRTTILLNILLFLLILVGIITVCGIWLLSRNGIKQIPSYAPHELEEIGDKLAVQLAAKVTVDFKSQTEDFNQQIEKLKADLINQLLIPISEAQTALSELRQQIDIGLAEIERLRYEQYYQVQSDFEQEIETQNYEAEYQTSEVVSDGQYELVAESEEAEAAVQEEFFNANDYLHQGEAHFAEVRYLEATQSYNAAVKLDPNLAEARYQNARSYAMQYRVNLAIGNLQWAIDMHEQYKEMAKTDSAFAAIRAEEQFKKLIYG